jgi:hypothetical protein
MAADKAFDPDRTNSSDIDLDDPDVLDAWLDDPNTTALHEDLGRAFRREPPEIQIAELEEALEKLGTQRLPIEAMVRKTDDPLRRLALEELLGANDSHMEAIRLRIAELRSST